MALALGNFASVAISIIAIDKAVFVIDLAAVPPRQVRFQRLRLAQSVSRITGDVFQKLINFFEATSKN